MAESTDELFARARAAADADGRLSLPSLHEWDTFPFEGELRVRPLVPPVEREPSRHGAGGVDCWRCDHGDANAIWSDERWVLTPLQRPSGLPAVIILFPRAHHDLDDLPDDLARELGPVLVRAHRAVATLPDIGRVHVCRWGDGSEHLHWWLMARPARLPQLVGSFAAIWDDILPPLPEDVWRTNLAVIAAAMAADGGVTHV